jgi:hypothetical protein
MVEVETVSGVAVNADCGVVDDRDLCCAMRQRREARQPRVRKMPEEVVGDGKINDFRLLVTFGDENERLEPGLAWRAMCNSDLRFCLNGLRSQAGLAHICC